MLACLNYSFVFDVGVYTFFQLFGSLFFSFYCAPHAHYSKFFFVKISLTCLGHTLSSCFLHILSILVIWYLFFCLMASLGFNLGHMSNLPHQLDCRGHIFYFVTFFFWPQGKAYLQFIRNWLQVNKTFHHPFLLQHSHSSGLLFM